MSNDKAMGPDGQPAELMTFSLSGQATEILYHFHSITTPVWTSGEAPQKRISKCCTRRIRPSVVTTGAIHSSHMRLKLSLKSHWGDNLQESLRVPRALPRKGA
ncbi:unnamed protein product [Sphacelaria rigidula]